MKYLSAPSSSAVATAMDPTSTTQIFELFDDLHQYQFASSTGPLGLFWTSNGTATFTKLDPSTTNLNRLGIVQFATGTTLTANATASSTLVDVQLGGATITYAAGCSLNAVPNGTENFLVKAGLVNTIPGAQNGVYLTADRTLSTTNWQLVTMKASSATVTDTGIPLATGYVNLRIVVNGSTNAQAYINGTLVATNTTNIPTTNGQAIGPLFSIQKVAGTVSQTVDVDWLYLKYVLGAARGTF